MSATEMEFVSMSLMEMTTLLAAVELRPGGLAHFPVWVLRFNVLLSAPSDQCLSQSICEARG